MIHHLLFGALFTPYSNAPHVAIFVQEYLSTLPAEVDLFWNTRLSGASALFFANRYLGLLNNNHLRFLGNIGIRDVSSRRALPLYLLLTGMDLSRPSGWQIVL